MIARALLMLFAVLLLVGAISSIIAPRELRAGRGAATLGALASNPAPRAGAPGPAAEIAGRVPSETPIKAKVGDVVRIAATSATDDLVDLPDLGIDQPVGPEMPALLELVADHPGRFPITLRYRDAKIGELVVTDDAQPSG